MISMNRDEFYSSLYLAHHGVKGQKWGERRYQNEDGSYTDLGAQRRRVGNSKSSGKTGMSDGAKKALKIGAAVAGTALAAYGAYKLRQAVDIPYVTHFAAKNAGKAISKAKDVVGKSKAGQFAGRTMKEAGKAAVAAAMTAVGSIAVSRIAKRYADKEGDSEATRNVKRVARDSSSAAVRSAANSAAGLVYNSSNGGGFSSKGYSDIVSQVGQPHQTHSWGDSDTIRRYNALMDRYRDNPEIKTDIRAMKKGAFDIEQIEKRYGGK